MIAEIGLAIETGVTAEDIALTIHAHPTFGEMLWKLEVALVHQHISLQNNIYFKALRFQGAFIGQEPCVNVICYFLNVLN